MSVTVTATIKKRPYPNPQNDPRLPVAVWYTQGAVLGDASGGFAEIIIELNPASAQRSGRSWSIETSMPEISAGVQKFRVATQNLDALGPGLTNAISKPFVQDLIDAGSNLQTPDVACLVRDIHPGVYLGAQSGSVTAALLQGQFENGDGKTYGWYATGYEWEPAALGLGHLKPIDGLI